MNIIITPAPISIEELKKFFVSKDILYVIDYDNSQLKGQKLLTYLSNLDIPCDIKIDTQSKEFEDLLIEYMQSHFLVHSKTLEQHALKIMLCHKKLLKDEKLENFISNNLDTVLTWEKIIDSLMVFNMFTIDTDEFKDHARSYPNDNSLVGINFVNLLQYPEFYSVFSEFNTDNFRFYSKFFEDFPFKGKGLFDFWANKDNHIYLLTWGIAEGIVTGEDIAKSLEIDRKFLTENNISF